MRIIFTGTWDWWRIVSSNEIDTEIPDNFDSDHEAAAATAGINTDDSESWVARVAHVDERHSAIKVGDFACCQGIGDDVIFVRA